MPEDIFLDKPLDKFIRWLRFDNLIREITPNSVVCDLGCGKDLKFLRYISSKIEKGIGIDKNCEDFQEGKLQRIGLKVDGDLPLEKESVDIVTMSAILEHLEHPEDVLKECYRALKKGGKIILTTPSPVAKPILEILAFRLKIIDAEEIRDHKNYFSKKDLKKILINSGFEQKNIKVSSFEFGLNNKAVAIK